MKKYVCLLIVLFLLLAGCNDHSLVRGTVTEVTKEPGIGLVSFVLENNDGRKVGVLLTDETRTMSWVNEYSGDDFLKGNIIGLKVLVVHGGHRQMKTSMGETIRAYNAKEIQIEAAPMSEYILSNGTTVTKYESVFNVDYYLPDGTMLLREKADHGPEHVTVQNLENYEDLNQTAQAAVSEYYDKMGRLYDLEEWLELIYSNYLSCENPEAFDSYLIGQEISPSAYNEELMWFRTVVTLPVSYQEITEHHICTAFRKSDGAAVPTEQLFIGDMETAVDVILRASGDFSEEELNAFHAAFQPEMTVFTPDGIEVFFMKGSLPGEDGAWTLFTEYTPEVLSVLQPWAVPTLRSE